MVLDTYGEGSTLLSITPLDGTSMNFSTIIETIDISEGTKDFDQINTIHGSNLKKFNSEESTEITIEGYAVEAGSLSTTGNGFYDLLYTKDSAQPISISGDHTRVEYQMCIMATDSSSQATAIAATSDGDKADRWVYNNGHFTKVDASFTDGVWKYSVTFKVTPYDKEGNSNKTFESTDGSTDNELAAVTYTS